MSQPTYKLYYFDLKGLAEAIRFLLAYGGIEYEDVRVARDDWPELKKTMPMGQLPVLEVDGKRVYQSSAISRYLAKKVGLAGSNDWESLIIDSAVDTINDFRLKLVAYRFESDEASKAKKLEEIKKETIPFYLGKLEAIAKENNGHLALGKLTWADIVFASILDTLNFFIGLDLTADQPNLAKVVSNVKSVESIAAWIAKRPQTDF